MMATTKTMAANAKVDWGYVEQVTEIPRTYYITTDDGRWFFKMYKPSEAKKVFKLEKSWHGKIVGKVSRK